MQARTSRPQGSRTASLRASGLVVVMVLGLAVTGCDNGGMTVPPTTTTFTLEIANIAVAYDFFASGAFDTPVGSTSPGALGPGQMYSFGFGAPPGSQLSFATMFVQSNDLFFAPAGAGIDLFDGSGQPTSGDVTTQVQLWDGGTELNEEPGTGANQAPRQSGANTGAPDPTTEVRLVDDLYTYPAVSDVIRVTITHEGVNEFTVQIENVSTSTTLMTSTGSVAVPLSPGVFVVHTQAEPLFTAGVADRGEGLEGIAEDGSASTLAASIAVRTGLSTPLSPGVWAVHTSGEPLFTAGVTDRGEGLEAIAEDGAPGDLATVLATASGVASSGAFDTPVGGGGPGPLLPGESYRVTLTATSGNLLSFATMFVQSNDLFYAPPAGGLALFEANGDPVNGDVTHRVQLWDAGTEVNQYPGAGPDQVVRQSAANTGAPDPDNTVRLENDSYAYPAVGQILRVTITPN